MQPHRRSIELPLELRLRFEQSWLYHTLAHVEEEDAVPTPAFGGSTVRNPRNGLCSTLAHAECEGRRGHGSVMSELWPCDSCIPRSNG